MVLIHIMMIQIMNLLLLLHYILVHYGKYLSLIFGYLKEYYLTKHCNIWSSFTNLRSYLIKLVLLAWIVALLIIRAQGKYSNNAHKTEAETLMVIQTNDSACWSIIANDESGVTSENIKECKRNNIVQIHDKNYLVRQAEICLYINSCSTISRKPAVQPKIFYF